MTLSNPLDIYLPARIRDLIIQRYLLRIDDQARMEQIIHDPYFYSDPNAYPPFFSDHGIVHHLDVARRILGVLDTVNGLLIPLREKNRLEIMKGYGVILACTHDIGMADFSPAGRSIHPQISSQLIFGPDFRDLERMIWDENIGNLAWRLTQLAERGALDQDSMVVLREMLAMVNCHSKSIVPISVLNNVHELRRLMQLHLGTPLDQLFHLLQIEKAGKDVFSSQEKQDRAALERNLQKMPDPNNLQSASNLIDDISRGSLQIIRELYTDFQLESFRWLVSNHPETQMLVADVIDTLRALRCADALRQRGTVLKTSGGYEIFVDQQSANALMGLRLGQDELYLLEIDNPLSAGEANIESSQLDIDGNLRTSFHRGSFLDTQTTQIAANRVAVAVNDIQADVIESFLKPDSASEQSPQTRKSASDMLILLESPDDNLEFADMVQAALGKINPSVKARTRCVPSMKNIAYIELDRYIKAEDVGWDSATRQEILNRIAISGQKTGEVDPVLGFENVKLVKLNEGDRLVEAGATSTFVYIPLGQGLRVIPLGGYASFLVRAWMPLGITGVIRGAERNATIIAEQPVSLLMIPKSVYLRYWHRAHSVTGLMNIFQKRSAVEQRNNQQTLTRVEKRIILSALPLFTEISSSVLTELVGKFEELKYEAGEKVFEKGELGDNLYIIADGRIKIHDGEQIIDILAGNDFFGEMALLDPEPRMASATALDRTRLLRLDHGCFQDLLVKYPEVSSSIIRVLTRRLRSRAGDLVEIRQKLDGKDGSVIPLRSSS